MAGRGPDLTHRHHLPRRRHEPPGVAVAPLDDQQVGAPDPGRQAVIETARSGPVADDEDRGPGATFYWEEDVRGKVYWNHFRITEWVPNRLFAWEMTESSFFKGYTERWTLERTDAGCRFSFDDDLVFPYGLWGKVMGWFGERMARKSRLPRL